MTAATIVEASPDPTSPANKEAGRHVRKATRVGLCYVHLIWIDFFVHCSIAE